MIVSDDLDLEILDNCVFNNINLMKKSRLAYVAPELLEEKGTVNYKSDIWGLGCIIFYVTFGFSLFEDKTRELILKKIK